VLSSKGRRAAGARVLTDGVSNDGAIRARCNAVSGKKFKRPEWMIHRRPFGQLKGVTGSNKKSASGVQRNFKSGRIRDDGLQS
jgi:hypothetical protein